MRYQIIYTDPPWKYLWGRGKDVDGEFIPILTELFAPISHLIKHDYFKHEEEWRLIYRQTAGRRKYIKGTGFLGRIYSDTEPVLFEEKFQTKVYEI